MSGTPLHTSCGAASHNGCSILLNADTARRLGLDDTAATELIRSLPVDGGRILKSDRRSDVRVHALQDREWVVKRYTVFAPKLWLYRFFRSSRCWREWRGAQRLGAAGVRSCTPLAIVHGRHHGRASESLVLPFVPGRNVARWLKRHQDPDERRRVADRLGQQLGLMCAAGIINRDHKASNVIIDASCAAGDVLPVIIDPAGLRRRRGDRQAYRMAALLYLTAGRRVPVPMRAAVRCLRAMLRADTTLAQAKPSRLRFAIAAIERELRRMPQGMMHEPDQPNGENVS